MIESHKKFQEAFHEFSFLPIQDKIKFIEALLFHFTLTGRALWSDVKLTDTEKVEGLKWLNELSHRIWNVKLELMQGIDDNSSKRLYENMKFYSEQSISLRPHLVPTLLGAYENFRSRS